MDAPMSFLPCILNVCWYWTRFVCLAPPRRGALPSASRDVRPCLRRKELHRNRGPGRTAVHPYMGIPAHVENASCRTYLTRCHNYGATMAGTTEKGVDILIATDLIRMAWEDRYDLAVPVTGDLVPCVKYLGGTQKGVVQARFAPSGAAIANAATAPFDLTLQKHEILRT